MKEPSSKTGRCKKVKAHMKIPRCGCLPAAMTKWNKQQKQKFRYLRDRIYHSNPKRIQEPKVLTLINNQTHTAQKKK